MQITWESFCINNIDARGIRLKFEDLCRQIFMITFFADKPTQTPTQTELSELVLAVIREHPEYSQKQIAEQLDWKRDRVKYYVKRLKDEKMIRRVGTTHKGYWEILSP